MANIHDGHRERVRAKFRNFGLNGMDEHEILELILFYAKQRGDTNALAHSIINYFGSFSAVFDATVEELMRIDGVGERTAILITLFSETFRAIELSKTKNIKYANSYTEIYKYIRPHYINKKNEMPSVLYLDAKKKILGFLELPEGTFKSAYFNVKTIVEKAVRLNAVFIILAHNHPSGLALPSTDDKETTRKLENVFMGLGLTLLDHLIFADDDFISFSQSGLLHSDKQVNSYFGVGDAIEK